jgi:hypothetical protein
MPAARQASARKRARKSTIAAEPIRTPLPPDAPPLLQAIDACGDIALSLMPAHRVAMLARVSNTMRAAMQDARPPASVQVRHLCTHHLCLCTSLHPCPHARLHSRIHTCMHKQTANTASPKDIAQGLKNLGQFCSIAEVYYSCQHQPVRMCADLRKAFVQCEELTSLSLAYVKMQKDGASFLAVVVRACSKLRCLDISKILVGDRRMQQVLAPALGECTTLDTLNMTMCGLGGEGSRALAAIFQSSLTSLKLNHNHVRYRTRTLAGAR